MKIRSNRKRILASIKTKKKLNWFVQSIIKNTEERQKTRLRIQALVDKSFPELIGVKI